MEVRSIAKFDSDELGAKYEELIRVLLRGLELPEATVAADRLESCVRGKLQASSTPITEADVHEALAAIKRQCTCKSELRYQLSAAVVLNAWIEEERRLGFAGRKKFYAFKQKVGELCRWAAEAKLPGVTIWAEPSSQGFILYLQIDGVDFSFHAIPGAEEFFLSGEQAPTWSGIRLKPIAPILLTWARSLLKAEKCG